MATPGKRPFWMHQIAEYIIAAAFIAQALQSPSPAVPSLLGGLVLLNAACAKAPAAAFRLVDRKVHRLLDLLVIGVIVVMALQPVVSIDNNTRVIMGVLAFVLAFIWLGSDFSPAVPHDQSRTAAVTARVADGVRQVAAKAPTITSRPSTPRATREPTSTSRTPTGSTSSAGHTGTAGTTSGTADTVGRVAGRLAGKGLNAYRAQSARRRKK